MRDIKFRQPLIIKGKFSKFHYWGFYPKNIYIGPSDIDFRIGKDSQQYTGLKDKNGKEIYEGDIVKECSWVDWRTNKNRNWRIGKIVIWEYKTCSFRLKEDGFYCFNMNLDCGYEIIGNIYENPELLTTTY